MEKIILGITGIMGSGKSTLSKEISKFWPKERHGLQVIELDDVRRYILWHSIEPEHCELRKNLSEHFGFSIKDKYNWLDRVEFTVKIFSTAKDLEQYSFIATPVLKRFVQKQINSFGGDSIVAWSYMIEESYNDLVNGSIIMTHCDEEVLLHRVMRRVHEESDPLPEHLVKQRISVSNKNDYKVELAKEKGIELIHVENTHNHEEQFFELLAETLVYDSLEKIRKQL